jgi:hypothetical protein
MGSLPDLLRLKSAITRRHSDNGGRREGVKSDEVSVQVGPWPAAGSTGFSPVQSPGPVGITPSNVAAQVKSETPLAGRFH